jgi:NAD+ kinase
VKRFGILSNPNHGGTQDLAELIRHMLCARGGEVVCTTADTEEQRPLLPTDIDLLITLGGDGTMLRASHLVAENGTPILGIHMGRLGFLAEVRVDEWQENLTKVFEGEYWLEERSMLSCEHHRGDTIQGPWDALNEAVVGRGGMSRTVQLATYVDGGYLTTFVADGLIVATATGSTAYALSAGGPILPPELRNMLLVPICPHLSQEHSIVLADGAVVTVQTEGPGEGVVVVDGIAQTSWQVGDRVVLSTSPHVTRFVRLYDRRQVYETLMERLQPRKVRKPND